MKATSTGSNSDSDLFKRDEPVNWDEAFENFTAANDSGLLDLFGCFLSLEHKGNSVHKRKAELFADAKKRGFDSKALRAAFRQRLRELEKPEVGQKHDALNSHTTSYLQALRGNHA